MSIYLSKGQSNIQSGQPGVVLTGEPLFPEEVDAILTRLPALPVLTADQVEFNRPAESLPPPRPGITLQEPFPPQQVNPTPAVSQADELKVLRFAPEGEVPLAPLISVTFNQPMVPLGTQGSLLAEDVPAQVEPALPGTWRWLGTQTLTFEYDSQLVDRFPKATEYRVTIPAGTTSISGATLPQPVAWKFTTPVPKIVQSYPPNSPQSLRPLFFIAFDQRIDPASVLRTIAVTAGNGTASLVLADEEEIARDASVSHLLERTSEGRWLAFRAREAFPVQTVISVVVGPGTPSAEGPLLTNEAQSFQFSTYAPLRVGEYSCGWGNKPCPPLTPFNIRFNNRLDAAAFTQDMLSVSPGIPGMLVNVYDNRIEVCGQTSGRTTYTVKISGGLKDAFGQTLGSDAVLTFNVGSADPYLTSRGGNFVTLDPSLAKPVYSVYVINYQKLDVKIYSVQPSDWLAYKKYIQDWRRTGSRVRMPGKLVSDRALTLNLPADVLSQVDVDLGEFMQNSFGHFVIVISPPASTWTLQNQTIVCWVQVTQIGLDAYTDHSDMIAWASSLREGLPLEGVTITPNVGGAAVQTARDGTVRFNIPSGAAYLVAQSGADQAILPRSVSAWGNDYWKSSLPVDELRWYVFDDRKIYRPGEDVHIKGWIRQIGGRQNGDVGLPGNDVSTIDYKIIDALGLEIYDGFSKVNALGGFDFVFPVFEGASLGMARLELHASGTLGNLGGLNHVHSFDIEEFRRPEFEVKARNETSGPYFVGGQAVVAVQASYYAGGALPNAEVTWQVSSKPTSYSPPNWPDFTFGTWKPWWVSSRADVGYDDEFTGQADADGVHYLNLEFDQEGSADVNPRPQSVVAEATVMDVNRQAWSDATTLLVHPADLYIGLRSERYFVQKNVPLKIEYIVTDLDGNAVAGSPVTITAARLEWRARSGSWQEEAIDLQTCVQISSGAPGACVFETPIGGTYQITAQVTDSYGRKNQASFTRWVSGGRLAPSRSLEQEKLTLIPDKQAYQPGDVAHILVQSSFSPAEGLMTVSRSGILYTTRFRMESDSITLDVPVEKQHIPNLEIQVNLAGSAIRLAGDGITPLPQLPARPAFASGTLSLGIPPIQRNLSLQVTPDERKLAPGGETTLSVLLKDAGGSPVPDAELAVVVVDEAILSLTGYHLEDPLDIFYADRPSYLSALYGRASILLADLLAVAGRVQKAEDVYGVLADRAMSIPLYSMPSSFAGEADSGRGAIMMRSNFNPLALFSPQVRTGMDGTARIPVKLPDNLTRYRVMVLAVGPEGQSFGTGESNIIARLPLMVRPSAPRFLNFGDHFELPVILQNQTDMPFEVSLAARAANLELTGAGVRVNVPANDRVEVRIPAAAIRAGDAVVQIGAVAGAYSDAAVVNLPVYTPSTTEAFTTYGVLDEGVSAQLVQYPTGVFAQYGGLEVTTSSTALQALTDAVLYLTSYPYECSEQLASRILAVAALKDVLTAFEADGLPSPATMKLAVDRDIQRLAGMQNYDGGFPTWRRGFDSNPFNTIHVAHALERAELEGFYVPYLMYRNVSAYLRNIETYYPAWYSQKTRWTLSAYALYVRNLAGDRDSARARKLIKSAGLQNLPLQAVGWLWPVVDSKTRLAEIRKYVNNHVVETAGAANFVTEYDDQAYVFFGSDRRTDAVLLDAIMQDNPQSDLVVKLVNGLLGHRTRGRWGNTQENVFVLLALDRYFDRFEAQTPEFVARLWLGDMYAGSSEFFGRTTEYHETRIPMSYVLAATAGEGQNVILSKEGPGRLYYRLGLRYAPTDLNLDPLDMGFVVERTYEGVDNKDDVSRDANGYWHIKAGSRVKVNISMVASDRRYHVALVDPLAAGLEILNPALAVSGSVPQNPGNSGDRYGWWWRATWYEHQNLRDDRAEAFASLVWDGVYTYSYIARATTPGTFVVPPAKAEEMYSPEVFGRSASDWVIIK